MSTRLLKVGDIVRVAEPRDPKNGMVAKIISINSCVCSRDDCPGMIELEGESTHYECFGYVNPRAFALKKCNIKFDKFKLELLS